MVIPARLQTFIGILALLLAFPALATDIEVSVDRKTVRLDESFGLVFTANDQPDGDPDFSPLRQDLEIRSQGQSSEFSMVNGKVSRRIQWTLNVMAKRAGDLTLPAIAFGRDRSRPFDLRVEAGRVPAPATSAPTAPSSPSSATAPGATHEEDSELFIEVDAEPKNPYVQAQVLYTVKIFRQVGLSNARLEEPKLDNAVLQRLTEDSQYNTQRNGQPYQVLERRFAIFPQQSGRLTIQPPVLEADVGAGRSSLFNRFFAQPAEDSVRLRGKTIELNVRPIPAQFTGKHWLPAKSVTLTETLSKDPPQVAAGEPLTRTLKLQARGSTVGNLPELGASSVAGVQAYPDQPALNEDRTPKGLNASREEKIALIPGQAGSYTLPELAIPWWNTEADRQELARIPARTITVSAAAGQPQATPPTVQPEALPQPSMSSPAATPLPEGAVASPAPPAAAPLMWMGLAAFFALGWLGTAIAWWRLRGPRRAPPAPAPVPAIASESQERRRLRQACAGNDAAAVRSALLAWAQSRWPEDPPRHLDQLAARAGTGLARQIERLNRASYGNDPNGWSGTELWQAVEALPAEKRSAQPDGLEPLHR